MHSARLGRVTDWLTDEEQRAWRGLLHMTAQLNGRLARQLQDEHEISLADYEVLVRLYEAPDAEGLRARDLEASLSWEQSRLSHQLTRMQRRGLVERGDCPADRRGATFAITPAGRAAIEHAAPGHVAAVRRLFFDHLTPEDVARLDELTARIIGRLS
jgi:DNA-binding MarR family transcriptional regulator